MSAHTQGEWETVNSNGQLLVLGDADEQGPRVVCSVGGRTPDERWANARLIAVAPRLVMHARGAWHLCQSLLATREGATDDLIRELADALHADIAKAEGR